MADCEQCTGKMWYSSFMDSQPYAMSLGSGSQGPGDIFSSTPNELFHKISLDPNDLIFEMAFKM